MSYYWDERFLKHLDTQGVKVVVEAGARYGDESAMLASTFKNAIVYAFECNPLLYEKCKNKRKNVVKTSTKTTGTAICSKD